MIDIISGIVKNLAIIILLAAFWQLLVPSGELSRFIVLIMGLVMVAIIIDPIIELFTKGDYEKLYIDTDYYSDSTEVMINNGEEISENLKTSAQLDYEKELSRQISGMVYLVDGVKSAAVSVEAEADTGKPQAVAIVVEMEIGYAAATIEGKIIKVISEFFGIDTEVVKCAIKEGEVSDDG